MADEKVKQEKHRYSHYGPVVLWWDDVEKIYEAMKAGARDISIGDGEYVFSTMESAKEHFGRRIQREFSLVGSKPFCRFSGSPVGVELSVSGGPTCAQIYTDVDEVLRKGERKPRFLYTAWMVVLIFAVFGSSFVLVDGPVKFALQILNPLMAAWFVYATYIGAKRHFVLHPQRRSETVGFVARSRDQIVVAIISALVGALITVAGTQIQQRYFPPQSQTK